MAVIPLEEEKTPIQVEREREEKTVIPVEGGFAINLMSIFMTLITLTIIFFLFFWDPETPILLPYNISIMPYELIPLLTILLIGLMINRSIVNFMEYERGVVFRWGRFNRIAGPGWEVVFPLMERYIKVDLRLEVITPGIKEVVTKDKVRFLVSPEIFMYVSNPKDAVLNLQNYKKSVIQYVNSALTHTFGDNTSDYIVAHMNEISDVLTHAVMHMAEAPGKEWGVVIPRVKVAYIRFPDEVQSAMHKKVASEQLKLAAHEKAEATRIEIDAIREAGGKLSGPALTYMYLDSLDKVAKGKATKIVVPLEITKMAEKMSQTAGAAAGLTPEGGLKLSPEMISQYTGVVNQYDQKIKAIEDKLQSSTDDRKERRRKRLEDKRKKIEEERRSEEEDEESDEIPEDVDEEDVDEDTSSGEKKEETDEPDEMGEYKDRIREIKKRVGIE